MELIKRFFVEEDGMGTVEIVIIVAVLVGLALLFREQIFGFAQDVLSKVFDGESIGDFLNDPTAVPKSSTSGS